MVELLVSIILGFSLLCGYIYMYGKSEVKKEQQEEEVIFEEEDDGDYSLDGEKKEEED